MADKRVVYVWRYGLRGAFIPSASYYFETEDEREEFLEKERLQEFEPIEFGYRTEIDNTLFSDEELDKLLNGELI